MRQMEQIYGADYVRQMNAAPDRQKKGGGGLDDWLVAFGIECPVRHNAAADAFATAEFLLHMRARAARQGHTGFASLLKLTKQQKWLASGH